MATSDKGAPLPPLYMYPTAASRAPYAPGTATGYARQQPPVQRQYPPGAYYPAPSSFGAVQPPPPANNQQTTNVVVVGGTVPVPVAQNVLVVQTVRTNVQIPEVYPGPAFCLFAPGIIETFIRSSIVVRQFKPLNFCYIYIRILKLCHAGDVIGLDCRSGGHH